MNVLLEYVNVLFMYLSLDSLSKCFIVSKFHM